MSLIVKEEMLHEDIKDDAAFYAALKEYQVKLKIENTKTFQDYKKNSIEQGYVSFTIPNFGGVYESYVET